MTRRPFWRDGTVTIHHASALTLPIPDDSVDLIVTSPPYFGLRSYTDGGAHYDGQIGSEDSPHAFLDALIAATAEMARVLKPSGSIWINLGDKYCSPGGHTDDVASTRLQGRPNLRKQGRPDRSTTGHGVRPKSLFGLPWRYALRCIDELGLILRAEVIWSKPNGLPESVTDRVRRSHEQWFHFTREPRYFSAVDEIREEHAASTVTRAQPHRAAVTGTRDAYQGMPVQTILRDQSMNALGALPRSVWMIPTQPLKAPWGYGVQAGRIARYFTDERDALGWLRLGHRTERRRIRPLPDHFAAFPMEWPRRLIAGWSPSGICVECGEGRRPVAERTPMTWRPSSTAASRRAPGTTRKAASGTMLSPPSTVLTGYACACPDTSAATRAAVVLDPFAGTGTVGVVARALGRSAVLIDLSADYCRLARWRVTDPGELAHALKVEKPRPVPVNADALFDLADTAREGT